MRDKGRRERTKHQKVEGQTSKTSSSRIPKSGQEREANKNAMQLQLVETGFYFRIGHSAIIGNIYVMAFVDKVRKSRIRSQSDKEGLLGLVGERLDSKHSAASE